MPYLGLATSQLQGFPFMSPFEIVLLFSRISIHHRADIHSITTMHLMLLLSYRLHLHLIC